MLYVVFPASGEARMMQFPDMRPGRCRAQLKKEIPSETSGRVIRQATVVSITALMA